MTRVRPHLPALALAVFALLVAAWMGRASWPMTWWSDDWAFVGLRRGWSVDALLMPHNGHLALLPALAYKLHFEVFGLGTYFPLRALLMGLHLLVVGLLFLLARPRIGAWSAAFAAGLLALPGLATEVVIYPFNIGFVGALAAGLGMLLALDRGRDGLASLLLGATLASSSVGAPFVLAALIERPRRLWVAGAPTALYLLWKLAYPSDPGGSALATVGAYVRDGLQRSAGAVLGLGAEWGVPLLLALTVLTALHLQRQPRVTRRLWSTLAVLIGFWTLTAFARGDLGTAATERYLYPGALFVLLLLLELLRGRRPAVRLLPLALVLAVVALSGARAGFGQQSALLFNANHEAAGTLIGLQLAGRDALPAGYRPGAMLSGRTGEEILDAFDDLGVPFEDPEAELVRRGQVARDAADAVLAARSPAAP